MSFGFNFASAFGGLFLWPSGSATPIQVGAAMSSLAPNPGKFNEVEMSGTNGCVVGRKMYLKDISARTGINYPEMLKFGCAKNIVFKDERNGFYLRAEDLETFFDMYYEGKHYSLKYRMPSWISHSSIPWCKALLEIYDNPISRPASISPQQGELIRSVIYNASPKIVVEIGTFLGVSTLWIASALMDANRSGKLYSIDLFADILPEKNGTRTRSIADPKKHVEKRLRDACLADYVQLIEGNSHDIGRQFDSMINGTIDVLYIDGDHSIHGCAKDLVLYSKFLSPGGIVIFHDIFPETCKCDGPRYVLDELEKTSGVSLFEFETSPHNFGIAVCRLTRDWVPRKDVLE